MDKSSLTKVVNRVALATKKHSPEILTGIGIAGMITTTIMAVKATPKALDVMADVKEKHEGEDDRKAFAKDVLTKVAPIYIPATVVGLLATGCLIGASSVNYKRNAALTAAYTISESALREYQEKVIETFGEKKEQAVQTAIAQDRVNQNPPVESEIFITEKGNTLCCDLLTHRYFRSDIDKLKRIEVELGERMLNEDYISLNDYYDEVGLHYTELGENLGWSISRGRIKLEFLPILTTEKEPCVGVRFTTPPYLDYDR